MTSYREINKRAKMEGYLKLSECNVVMSKLLFAKKKFPHVKYVNQLIKDNKR